MQQDPRPKLLGPQNGVSSFRKTVSAFLALYRLLHHSRIAGTESLNKLLVLLVLVLSASKYFLSASGSHAQKGTAARGSRQVCLLSPSGENLRQ